MKKVFAYIDKSQQKSNPNGFTLAEVLITLGIVGVVAAMTMPTLLNKTRNKEYKQHSKKHIPN